MKRWLPWSALIVAMIALAVNVGAATAYFYDSSRADVVAAGVTVAGVPVGGLSAATAQAKLDNRLVPRLQRPLTFVYGSRTFELHPRRAGLEVHVGTLVDRALQVSRRGSLLHRVVRDVRGQLLDASIPVDAGYSQQAVLEFVDRVARLVDHPPRAARVVARASQLTIRPSHDGVAVSRDKLAQVIEQSLLDTTGPRHLRVPTHAVPAKVTAATLTRRYPAYITVDREHFRLTFWRRLKRYKRYTIAVGRQGLETPAGTYRIDNKQLNPSWHVPLSAWAGALAGQVIPPGPADPIKARWMGFYNGAGIHGTDQIYSLGTAASHGCIRMSIPDVEELYDLVPLGTPIYVG
jgi:hypothetical protein